MRPLRPVALERRPAVVKLPALELDNDVGTGPGHVDLIAGNPGVDLRRREPLVAAKTQEPRLQPGLRLGDAGRIEPEELAEDRHPAPAGVRRRLIWVGLNPSLRSWRDATTPYWDAAREARDHSERSDAARGRI
jgi:hypothetical protein